MAKKIARKKKPVRRNSRDLMFRIRRDVLMNGLEDAVADVRELNDFVHANMEKQTKALTSIASSLNVIAQYAADYATRDRVQRLLTADASQPLQRIEYGSTCAS